MVKKILILCVAGFVVFGCKKKETKPEEVAPESLPGGQDTNIQGREMSFNAQGSDSGQIDGLYTIHFDYDKATLSSEGRQLAQKNAEWMKNNPKASLQIEGHCDRHGSIEYNLALGERRARTVLNYLVNLGVSSSRLSTVSYGKEKPLELSETETADAKNRRANFLAQ